MTRVLVDGDARLVELKAIIDQMGAFELKRTLASAQRLNYRGNGSEFAPLVPYIKERLG